ncbi:CBF/Mak21 family protein [Aphelenchoides bicaudatus]|nr:CBF/Mak21 family protein [Aphelenchoides bicaudatus]
MAVNNRKRKFGGDKWYETTYNEVAESKFNHADQTYLELYKKAEKLLKREVEEHERSTKMNKKSEEAWLGTVVEKGTMSDRMSAVQLKFQQSPVQSLFYLEKLVVLLEKKKMRDSVSLFRCLKEIMVKDLLPPHRKLIAFDMRPLNKVNELSSGNFSTVNRRLIMWKFEDDLKKMYQRIVVAGQDLASSQVEGVAEQACIIVADLLILCPEQEQFLLNALVNKIGHPKKKVDVTVTKQLERLLEKHPNMRLTVATELERLIFRKNIIERTQFYAIHSLNRIQLRSGDDDLALKLLRIYFSLFKILIVKDATSSRLLEMVVRGANQSFPYAKDRSSELTVETDDFYKLVHTTPKLSTALSILNLLYQMQTYNSNLSDRFYSVLYQRILRVRSSSADAKFFYLMRQALKTDTVIERVRAFVKRLMQLALNNSASFAAAALLTYDELLKDKPSVIKVGDEKMQKELVTKLDGSGYKPEVRNPLFARADLSTDTELLLLSQHFHPSVAHFAQSIVRGKPIVYKGNALMDFTLIRFLDRLAFKNPKQKHKTAENGDAKEKEKAVKEEDELSDVGSEEFDEFMEVDKKIDDMSDGESDESMEEMSDEESDKALEEMSDEESDDE